MGATGSKCHADALFIDIKFDTWCDLDAFAKAETYDTSWLF
jgi:hypothetical protein